MTAVSQIGFVLYTPAFSAISVSLRLSSNEVQLTLTSYLLAFGLAQLVYGLLSDCWGRKKLLIIGVGVFSVGCLCAFVATGYRSFSFSERLASPPFLVGWVTFFVAAAYYIGAQLNRRYVKSCGTACVIKWGLALILISGSAMLASFILTHQVNFIAITVPLFVATVGQGLIFSTCIACALKDFKRIAGTAAAYFSCLQMLLASLISFLVSLLPVSNQAPFAIALILLGFASLCFLSKEIFGSKKASLAKMRSSTLF